MSTNFTVDYIMMQQEGDGSWQRKIDAGLCPRCESTMRHMSDGLEQDYMSCYTCNLVMLTPTYNELEIVVELEE